MSSLYTDSNKKFWPRVKKIASRFYSSKLPYHNFKHALKAFGAGRKIIRNCRRSSVPIDEDVVLCALFFHDAGYVDYKKKGFKCREDYAAHLAKVSLKKLGAGEKFIGKVVSAVLGTHRVGKFTTNEAKAVRAADLAGLAASYRAFFQNNMKLKREAEMLSGRPISLKSWQKQTKEIVEFYLAQDIRLTPAYADKHDRSVFHQKARKNLKKFVSPLSPLPV